MSMKLHAKNTHIRNGGYIQTIHIHVKVYFITYSLLLIARFLLWKTCGITNECMQSFILTPINIVCSYPVILVISFLF